MFLFFCHITMGTQFYLTNSIFYKTKLSNLRYDDKYFDGFLRNNLTVKSERI